MIATLTGEKPVEALVVGDRLVTRDNGLQPVTKVACRTFSASDLDARPHLRPMMIKVGAIGPELPETDLLVSPATRLLVMSGLASTSILARKEALIAARRLADKQDILASSVAQVDYVHFECEQHEIILANGAWTEAFHSTDRTYDLLGASQAFELFEIFPDLAPAAAPARKFSLRAANA